MSFLKAIMNVRDAANLLGCTERHIEGLCCNGRLRGAKKKGGLWEIPLAAIQAYEREQPARLLVDKQLLYRVRDYLSILRTGGLVNCPKDSRFEVTEKVRPKRNLPIGG